MVSGAMYAMGIPLIYCTLEVGNGLASGQTRGQSGEKQSYALAIRGSTKKRLVPLSGDCIEVERCYKRCLGFLDSMSSISLGL